MTAAPAKKSDLGVRAASAVVMAAIAGTALWLGGWVFDTFAILVGLAVLSEWQALANRFAGSNGHRIVWFLGGTIYVGLAVSGLVYINHGSRDRLEGLLVWIGMVVATDICAYFAGRTFGGPKIAPKISPSKTWAGLIGGMAGASLVALLPMAIEYRNDMAQFARGGFEDFPPEPSINWPMAIVVGCIVAVVAQSGDFFESWMKRRAGVKDSGHLIPGHGGFFDRVDGLLAVMAVGGILSIMELWLR